MNGRGDGIHTRGAGTKAGATGRTTGAHRARRSPGSRDPVRDVGQRDTDRVVDRLSEEEALTVTRRLVGRALEIEELLWRGVVLRPCRVS